MDIRHFERAERHRAHCHTKLTALRSAKNFAAAADFWSELLMEQQRWFTRMQQAFSKGPSSAWFGKIKASRKSDPFLVYMHHARHADEHGLEDIASQESGWIGIGGGGDVAITNISLRDGVLRIEGEEDGGLLKVEFVPAHLKLHIVENRGVSYHPPLVPSAHHANQMKNATAIEAGEFLLKFIDTTSAEGKKFFHAS